MADVKRLNLNNNNMSKTVIMLGLTCHPGMYSVFLLEDSAFKYTPSYDAVISKFTLTFNKPQSKHKMVIKTSELNSLYSSSI